MTTILDQLKCIFVRFFFPFSEEWILKTGDQCMLKMNLIRKSADNELIRGDRTPFKSLLEREIAKEVQFDVVEKQCTPPNGSYSLDSLSSRAPGTRKKKDTRGVEKKAQGSSERNDVRDILSKNTTANAAGRAAHCNGNSSSSNENIDGIKGFLFLGSLWISLSKLTELEAQVDGVFVGVLNTE